MKIDFHNDTVLKLNEYGYSFYEGDAGLHVDRYKMKESGVDAFFFAVCTSPVYSYENSKKFFEILKGKINTEIFSHNDYVQAFSLKDLDNAVLASKKAIFLCLEGAYPIISIEDIDKLYNVGLRLVTLTHLKSTSWAGAVGSGMGLSKQGRAIIDYMQEKGIIVDLAHASEQTTNDVLQHAKRPVVYTHGGARAISKSERMLSDEAIKKIADSGGLVGLSLFPEHHGCKSSAPKNRADLVLDPNIDEFDKIHTYFEQCYKGFEIPKPLPGMDALLTTIKHVINVGGEDVVSIGTDFDGIPYSFSGLEDISKMKNLETALYGAGFSNRAIEKFLGMNIYNFLKAQDI